MAKVKEEKTSNRKSSVIEGGKVLIFGDLHLSAIYQGKHKSYIQDCYETMDRIVEIAKETRPSAIIFTGDLMGVNERNIRDHQFLMRVVMFFGMLYNITKGNVYAVRGNHDIGDFTDFDLILGLGYFKNPKYVDYRVGDSHELRFHFVNYGEEHNKLEIDPDSNASNVVIGHADYYIDGVTNWYSDKKNRVELKTLNNFIGVDLVVSGHIHRPSEEMVYTALPNGETVGLFYVGSPSRTAERYDDCWYFSFEYDSKSGSTGYDAYYMNLKPASEVFYDESEFDYEEEESETSSSEEALNLIINEIMESRLATGDIFGQIDRVPADEDCKEIARKYLRQAIDGGK